MQRGMNFSPRASHSVLLSSLRPNAPYDDRIEENGTVLIYEGHDESRTQTNPYPKLIDQPLVSKSGKLTQNGLFHEAAQLFKQKNSPSRRVRVYEKIKDGIWSYNGVFILVDSWLETNESRQVFRFRLCAIAELADSSPIEATLAEPRRIIPTGVKLTVWKRDQGRCVNCGATTELHFDHILPFSKGGTSDTAENIQLLCMRHNLQKSARIV